MIDVAQLIVVADKTGLELERALHGIPFRHATLGEEEVLEQFGNAAEVELGHMMDWRVLWSIYLRRMAQGLAQYMVQMGSGEYILHERLLANPDALQACSTMGFPCRVSLVKDGERGVLSLDVSAANYKPGELPPELTDV